MVASADIRALAIEAVRLVSSILGSLAAARSTQGAPSCPLPNCTCHCAAVPQACPAVGEQAPVDHSLVGLVTVVSNLVVAACTFVAGRRSARPTKLSFAKGGTKGGAWINANGRK